MKIIQHTYENSDYRSFMRIELIDDSGVVVDKLSFGDGEPEDANLSRDFSDCWSIVSFVSNAKRLSEGKELDFEERSHADADNFFN